MSKILLIGDPHLKISNLQTAKKFLDWVADVVDQIRPDKVVNLGDTFDTHSVLRSELLAEFKKHVLRITAYCEYIYVLGNHDMFKPNDSTYHALQPFMDEYGNFTVIDKMVHRDDLGITFVPYLPNHDLFPSETLSICITHQTFLGCDFGGYKPESGIDPDNVSADLIISGHIHKKQSFGKVVYPGSPYAQSMKDINQIKGLMVLDTKTFKTSFIQTPLPSWRSLEIDVSNIDDTISTVKDLINPIDNWVVVFTGPRKEISALLDSKEWKSLCNKVHISTRTKYIDSNRVQQVKINSYTVTDIAAEYIDKVYSGGLDKALIKKTMRQLFDNFDKNSV